MPSTGNKIIDFFIFIILIIVCVVVLFRVLDIFDEEAGDGAFFDSYVTEVVG